MKKYTDLQYSDLYNAEIEAFKIMHDAKKVHIEREMLTRLHIASVNIHGSAEHALKMNMFTFQQFAIAYQKPPTEKCVEYYNDTFQIAQDMGLEIFPDYNCIKYLAERFPQYRRH